MRALQLAAIAAWLAAASISTASIHPWGDVRANVRTATDRTEILAGSEASAEVRSLVAAKCGDCHSNTTRWPVYSRFAPVSWLLERDVARGREHLNLSNWESVDSRQQIGLLSRISAEVRTEQMPLPQYLLLHPEARLTDEERGQIAAWTTSERKRLRQQTGNSSEGARQ